MNIGKLKLENNLILAPLHGVNCSAFRLLCRKYGAGLVTTSMIHPESIFNEKDKIDVIKEEKPVAIQIVGKDRMDEAAIAIEHKADMINLNFGCPDKAVLANKAGAFLTKHPEQMEKVVSKVVSAVNIPVTAKIRIGWDNNSINALEVSKILENNNVDAIMIHGRTRKQGYTGKANWNVIKEVKEKVNIPIIGNGDVFKLEDYHEMLGKTKVDGVMIGRGAIGNPQIFEECLTGKEIYKDKEYAYNLFEDFLKYYQKYSIRNIFSEIRQHAMWFCKGINNGAVLKNKLLKTENVDDIKKIIKEF